MDTQRPEEHGLLAWFLSIMQGKAHQDSGWQRERQPEQETGGYELPDLLGDIAGGRPWYGPSGTWRSVYLHEVPRRKRGDTPIPPVRETGGMLALPAPKSADPRAIADLDTLRQLPEPPAWLPIQRQQPANQVTAQVPLPDFIGGNERALDNMLATFRRRESYQLEKPGIHELPTVPSRDGLIARTIKSLPPAHEDFPRWLNDAPPPALVPLPEDALAASDKIANPLGVTEEDMQDQGDGPPTEMTEQTIRNRIFKQAIDGLKGKKESE